MPGGTSVTPEESLDELASLAETAGMEVVGRTKQAGSFPFGGGRGGYVRRPSPSLTRPPHSDRPPPLNLPHFQSLDAINPRTYLNSGKLLELAAELAAARADTVVFDDELTPGQLRNLERALGPVARLCDRTALILDIFSQRAGSREGQLQVALAQATYQLPRLTRMWTHLERQSGSGQVKGMGEKQIEVDKRLLRTRMAGLRRDLDDVRRNRAQYRSRREEAGLPVIALVGYTSAGKSSLFNALTGAGVLADDRLFATLDPTTRRLKLPSGKEALMSDTVGFIQKLPTQLVAAFRATLEEAASAGLLLHVVDVSHPAAAAQSATVAGVLAEMGAGETPLLTVWNKVDVAPDPDAARAVAAGRADTLCVSALTGEGLEVLLAAVEAKVADGMQLVHALVPFHLAGDLLAQARASGIVAVEAYVPAGALLTARVPPALAARLAPYTVSADTVAAGAAEAAGVAEASTA